MILPAPLAYKIYFDARVGEDLPHLQKSMITFMNSMVPYGYCAITLEGSEWVATGLCFNVAFFAEFGRFCMVTARRFQFVDWSEVELYAYIKQNETKFLNIYPMGKKLYPKGDTVVAVPIYPSNQQHVITKALEDYDKRGTPIAGRVIAVGPDQNRISVGDEILCPRAPGALIENESGVFIQMMGKHIEVVKKLVP